MPLQRIRNTVASIVALGLLATLAPGPPARAGNAAQVRSEAFKLLNQGVTAYRKGDYATAVERLQRASNMALNNFRAYYYLGLARIGHRRYAEALEALAVALDLDPDHLQTLVATGDAHLKLGDLGEARAAYFLALKLRPEYAPALDGLARIYDATGDETEAIRRYRRAIASDQGFAPAYTHLGDLYLRRDELEEAVLLLEEAVAVRPDFAAGLNTLALAYGRLGLHNHAGAAIQAAIELEPNEASHPATLGLLQLDQGLVQTAEEAFLRALELDEALPEARMGLAEAARRRGEYALALGQLHAALSDPRLDAIEVRRLREIRASLTAEMASFRTLERSIASGNASEDDHAALARIYAGRRQWDEAIELQRGAPRTAGQRERLAYFLFRAARFREAHEVYEALTRDDPSANLEVNNGVCAALLGDDRAAAAAYGRALELEPGHRQARLYLGNSLLRLGEIPPAVDAYAAFLGQSTRGEAAERVRRILEQIAPDRLPRPPVEIPGDAGGETLSAVEGETP